MKKLLIGFVAGFVLASILAIPCIKFVMYDKYKFGHNNGVLDGESEVLAFLSRHFEVRYAPEHSEDSLIMKPGGVFVIEDKGVLTIQTKRY
jgi:hypothetical protein